MQDGQQVGGQIHTTVTPSRDAVRVQNEGDVPLR